MSYLLPCLVLLVPLVVFAGVVHACERMIQTRLADRFGWNSVLVTGWLGTPIHESSHAIMCWVFRHRIDEVSFFEPDRKSGRLGYVRHSFHAGNWFEELGNVFIGVAPLMGGAAVLLTLTYLFYPGEVSATFQNPDLATEASLAGLVDQLSQQTASHLRTVFAVENWRTPRFWIFLYLVLCVGSHMAPSRSDYQGSLKGAVIALLVVVACIGLLIVSGVSADSLLRTAVSVASPLLAVLALAAVLVVLATVIVVVLTTFVPRRT